MTERPGLDAQHGELAADERGATAPHASTLPRDVALAGGAVVTLRLMTATDLARLAGLLAEVPPDDLLALRRVSPEPESLRRWVKALAQDRAITVLAERDGRIVGEASLRLTDDPALAHTGEIEVVVAPPCRAQRLGAALASEVFLLALARGVQKVVAPMTLDAAPAVALFQALGFQVEGLLRGQLRDSAGAPHDLVLMGLDVDEFCRRLAAYGLDELADG